MSGADWARAFDEAAAEGARVAHAMRMRPRQNSPVPKKPADPGDGRTMRSRHVRMSDLLWEELAALAERNGRTVAEELRLATESWLRLAGGVNVRDERSPRAPHANIRQHDRMK